MKIGDIVKDRQPFSWSAEPGSWKKIVGGSYIDGWQLEGEPGYYATSRLELKENP